MIGKVFLSKRLIINNNTPNIIDPFIEVPVPFLPTTLSFSLYATIIDENAKKNYSLKFSIQDHTGYELMSIDGNMDNVSGINEKGVMPVDINFDNVIFKNPGEHTCTLIVDGAELDVYTFYIDNHNTQL